MTSLIRSRILNVILLALIITLMNPIMTSFWLQTSIVVEAAAEEKGPCDDYSDIGCSGGPWKCFTLGKTLKCFLPPPMPN